MKAKFNLAPLTLPVTPPEPQSVAQTEQLQARLPELAQQIRSQPTPTLRPDGFPPSYQTMQQTNFAARHGDYRLHTGGDVFIHATREQGRAEGEFQGDKVHLSVHPDHLDRAFAELGPLLFSGDSPIDKWKVTDLAKVDRDSRVAKGAQFTLYIKPEQADSQYQARDLGRVRHFIEQLESSLNRAGIPLGEAPASDVAPHHWHYTSYRNEHRSDRDGSADQATRLREEPVYRLLTE
ncbi:hypothetical protein [Aeromonas schubertii]|uniref:Type III effector phosphothreonine lyase n=1 Tax=Aeromonas schubertii TaxID=652 RepID=A0ABS7VG45_9GAMM|nr:hypothetical protein [Aeromonas schubertii]MBZ6068374.1 type III effector phosphothreonine lyase [Aeromonas schubertii]